MTGSDRFLTSWPWFWRKVAAFLRRDLLSEVSYRLQFLFNVGRMLFTLLIFYFISQMVGPERARHLLSESNGDYFSYAVVGLAFIGFLDAGIISFTSSLRQQMSTGVLEVMAAAPIRSAMLLFYSILWPIGFELLKSVLCILIGMSMGAHISFGRAFPLLCTTIASVCVSSSLGIIGGSLIVFFKKGDPIAWFMSSSSALLGGVYFPVSILPKWTRVFTEMNPVTHALRAFRTCLIPGAPAGGLYREVLCLTLFGIVLAPTARWCANKMFEKTREEGSLGLY